MFCEKCGFEYSGARCPVCEIEERERAERIVAARIAREEQAQQVPQKKSSLGLVSLILAIASFVIGYIIPGFPEMPLAIAALIISISAAKKQQADKCSKAGLFISIAKIALTVFLFISAIVTTVVGFIAMFISVGFSLVNTFAALVDYIGYFAELIQSIVEIFQ